MRKIFISIYTAIFVLISLLLVSGFSDYRESANYITIALFIVIPYCLIFWILWKPRKISRIPYMAILATTFLSLLALIYPVTASVFILGNSSNSLYYGSKSIFNVGIFRFFNNTTTGEVMLFEVISLLMLHSAFAAIFYFKDELRLKP